MELLADFVRPFDLGEVRGKKVGDIGAGTGRFTRALLEAGAAEVVAVEPSAAAEVIPETLAGFDTSRVRVLQVEGGDLPEGLDLDLAFSVGVLHHIAAPEDVVLAVYRALKPGGRFVVWLYGREGNGLYLALALPLRRVTKGAPHALRGGRGASPRRAAAVLRRSLSAFVPGLPLADYVNGVVSKLPPDKRRLVIYDQLNPRYAKYYRRQEAIDLMAAAPFEVEIHPRRGFSWVVIGTKSDRFSFESHPLTTAIMPNVPKVLHVVGARPNFMKIAPVMDALSRRAGRRAAPRPHGAALRREDGRASSSSSSGFRGPTATSRSGAARRRSRPRRSW